MVLKWIYHAAYSAAQSEKHVHRNHTLESDVDSKCIKICALFWCRVVDICKLHYH